MPAPKGNQYAKGNKGGRPKKVIDYDAVKKLASIMATQEEIATFLELSVKTLQKDKEFMRIYKEGLDKGKMSLRRMQMKSAEKGNVTMLIWLGKQYLGQKEQAAVENTNLNTELPTIVVDDSEQ